MTEEELKQKCKERAKIFQQAMESCHSLNLTDCIEWFADRIADLEKQLEETKLQNAICEEGLKKQIAEVEQEVELWKKASENNSYKAFQLKEEIAELKEQNTNLQEMLKTERSVTCKEEYLKKVTELEQENAELKSGCGMCYRKDKELLTKAKEYIKLLLMNCVGVYENTGKTIAEIQAEAKQFLSKVEK